MEKWAFIAMAVIFGSLAVGNGVEAYQINQCKIAAVQANMAASDIEKVCKK